MCQYSSVDGHPTDWHLVHLGSFARGGAGLVIAEATAVTPEGRISPQDAGIWTDAQAADYAPITAFIRSQGTASGIQLAHAGRKASTASPWAGFGSVGVGEGGWEAVAPSAVAFEGMAKPHALTIAEVEALPQAFAAAAERSVAAGFDVVEVHAAHGYLLHQFLSPLANQRTDSYGGDFSGRTRLLLEVVDAVRAVWPMDRPLFVRLSATDWAPGGWDLDQTVELSRLLAAHGVDLIDVSSGGAVRHQQISPEPGYQVPFARAVRERSGVLTSAVGLITEPAQAEAVLTDGCADAVMIARAALRDPSWPQSAAFALGAEIAWPPQYERGRPA